MTNRLVTGNHTHTDKRPITWTNHTALPGVSGDGIAVYYTGSLWIGVTKAEIYTSTDPLTLGWTVRYTPASPNMNGFATDGAGNYAVTFNDGGSYAIITATNPEGTWTYNAAPAGMKPQCITYGNGKWVIGTYPSQLIWTASSPTGTWTSVATPLVSGDGIFAITYGGGYYLAGGGDSTGNGGFIMTATDANGPWTINSHVDPYFVYKIEFGDGYYSFTTNASEVYYSTNPTALWGLVYTPGHQVMYAVSYANDTWLYGGIDLETAVYPTGPFLETASAFLVRALGYGNGLWISFGEAAFGPKWATAVPGV